MAPKRLGMANHLKLFQASSCSVFPTPFLGTGQGLASGSLSHVASDQGAIGTAFGLLFK